MPFSGSRRRIGAGLLLTLIACSPRAESRAPTISGQGVGCLTIGAPVAGLAAPCRVLDDRTGPGAEGMPERRIVVSLGADTLTATVVADSVWRIEVDGSRLRTSDGIGVGSGVRELLERPGSRMIGGEGLLFVTLSGHCGMSFQVPLDGLSQIPEEAAREVTPEARVSRVLLFGCDE